MIQKSAPRAEPIGTFAYVLGNETGADIINTTTGTNALNVQYAAAKSGSTSFSAASLSGAR
jgi:hypothetical protein